MSISTVNNGEVVIAVGPGYDNGFSVAIDSLGRIVLAGMSDSGTGYRDYGVVRLNPDGTLDPTFNGTGAALVPVGATEDRGLSVVTQSDGKIVVGGYSFDGGTAYMSATRLNSDGTPDASFNGTGKELILAGPGRVFSACLQPDGKILLAGDAMGGAGNSDFCVVRLNADGSPDSGFNGTGRVVMPIGSSSDYGQSVIVLPDGKIVVAGASATGSGSVFGLMRLNADGSLDTGFNGTGTLMLPVGGVNDFGQSVAVQADGKLIVAGGAFNGTGYDFGVVRLNVDGSLDSTFNGSGKLLLPVGSGDDWAMDVLVQPDGKILLSGSGENSPYFALARLNPDGTPDTTFDGDGREVLSAGAAPNFGYSIALDASGRIVLAGTSGGDFYDFSALRLNTDGSVDTSFGIAQVNHAPTGSVMISGTAQQGQTLVAGNTLADADGLGAFDYQWQRDGAIVASATSSNYLLTQDDVGHAITVAVSYVDGSGNAESVTSSATAPVANVNDLPTGQATIDGSPVLGQTLLANTAGIGDADGLGAFSYQWLRDGSAIAGATASQYELGDDDVGSSLTVKVLWVDGGGTSESLTSSATAVVQATGVLLTGTAAADLLVGGSGWDTLSGGAGNDTLVGNAGADKLDGGAGSDRMDGGAGNDTYYVDNAGDVVVEAAGGGIDMIVTSVNYTLPVNVENLSMTGNAHVQGVGNALDNIIIGNATDNWLTGGLGADTLTAGLGPDHFAFTSVADSPATGGWDTITDFSHAQGDRLELKGVDANSAKTGDQAFIFIGTAAFSANDATAQLRFDPATHMLLGSTDADPDAEFAVYLVGVTALVSGDFQL